MLGEMLQYKNFHDDPTKPPFPWDPEAARWSREYRKTHPNAFPVDTRELMRPERVKLGAGKQDNKKDQKKPSIKFSDPVSANKSTTKAATSSKVVKPKSKIRIK